MTTFLLVGARPSLPSMRFDAMFDRLVDERDDR